MTSPRGEGAPALPSPFADPAHPRHHEWLLANTDLLNPIETVSCGAVSRDSERQALPFTLDYEFEGHRRTLDHLIEATNTTAIAILYQGRMVYEAYPGSFARPETRLRMYSITKSVTSLLVGIALERGLIGSLEGTRLNSSHR